MAISQSSLLVSIWFVIYLLVFPKLDPVSAQSCPQSNTSLLNFTTQFVMAQHQLRGSFSIINDCSFRVSEFDMLPGSSHVHWWGALGDDYENLTSGFVISEDQLNTTTYKNETFTVNLMKNITWDQIKVVSVWDTSMASDFGHVLLQNTEDLPPDPSNSSLKIHQEPTMFENCKVLSDTFRLRWTLNEDKNLIDIGLEGAIGIQNYMAFGWTEPNHEHDHMLNADVAFTGFTEEGVPFADDYYITKYSECIKNENKQFEGVCPDTKYNISDSDSNSDSVSISNSNSVNNTNLVYAHRKDGVSFIRYQRPLKSTDKKYDWDIEVNSERTCIWALGLIKPPDSIRPFYLPQNHGKTFGHVHINVSVKVNDCLGPLNAEVKEDQELVIADKKEPLVVTSGPSLHYPNPPNPSKVLYINKKETPVLRVERGVPVKFSIQAGHDVAFYVTSDPLGGNATTRNSSETVYSGGPAAQGVQSAPQELIWAPDRNTPDHIYYQSVFTPKMGWKVEVVDGGLTDMYKNSVLLDDQQVNFFWTLSESEKTISIAARAEKKSGYLAIGFGSEMENSFAYVGWVDVNGSGRVDTYWITGMTAQSLHPTSENLTYVRCKSESGVITLEFTRPLDPNCDPKTRIECNNIIEPTTPLKLIWAMGAKWSAGHLTQSNVHSVKSSKPVRVSLTRGSAEAEEDLRPVLAVHGFMMFLAWGILLPGGILAARYTKHLTGEIWFKIHVYSQYSGLVITFLGILFAVAELRGFHLESLHVKFGILTILTGCIQPINAYFRPKKNENPSPKRAIWEFVHMYTGRSAIVIGIFALISGMKQLGNRYDDKNTIGLTWALIIWVGLCGMTVLYLEYNKRKDGRELELGSGGNWVLGNGEEEDSGLLGNGNHRGKESESERMEVQLEPVSGRYTVI
ncbi:hypothetical protein LXL04_015452 [Taraxacum kok-saghyz]